MRCITSARFNMTATVLNRIDETVDQEAVPVASAGHYETRQDPDTFGLKRVWVADPAPARPGMSPNLSSFDVPCLVRGFTDLGFRSSANTEGFLRGDYNPTEVISMTFPSRFILNRRQYVTNIRNKTTKIMWMEEENGTATVFEVQGVTPGFDPFGRHVDNTAILKRAVLQ